MLQDNETTAANSLADAHDKVKELGVAASSSNCEISEIREKIAVFEAAEKSTKPELI